MSARNFATAAALLACLLVAGCATPQQPQLGDDDAQIAPGVVFVIPPPQALDETAGVTQAIVAHYRDQSYSFDVQIQIAPDELDLVALDGLGRRALTVTWKSGNIDYKPAPWLPPLLRPADILADIAIVYWPQEAIASSLAATGATLSQTDSERRISAANHDLIVVTYGEGTGWNRSAKLRNLAFGYEIDIQSAQLAP